MCHLCSLLCKKKNPHIPCEEEGEIQIKIIIKQPPEVTNVYKRIYQLLLLTTNF